MWVVGGGGGDTDRAVPLARFGGEPRGPTEAMQVLIGKYRSLLPAPDVVRLLSVLTELEPQLRSSGNVRLAVELLLLRWAMMARTVELQAVIEALGKRETGGGMRDAGGGPATTPLLRDAGSGTASTHLASRIPHPDLPPPEKGALTLDRLRALWPRIVDDARAKTPMLGALLQVTEAVGVDAGAVTIRLLATNAVHAEGLWRQRDALAQLVARYVTEPVRIKLQGAVGSRERASPRPGRLTEEGARAERLQTLRAQDTSLTAAADGLDMALLE